MIGERIVESRFEARASGAMSNMVGRDHELALTLERWKQAKAGEGQLVLLSGEAGIGKSRLARGMIEAVSSEVHIRVSNQCSPYHSDLPALSDHSTAAIVTSHSGPNSIPSTGVHEKYHFIPLNGEASFVFTVFESVLGPLAKPANK